MRQSLPLFIAVLILSGCWTTKEQGQALQRDVEELKKRLHRDIQQSKDEREKLQKVMEQATALLTRNSADVGAQVERMQARLAKITGQVDEQEKKLDDINQQLAKMEVKLDNLASGAQPKQPPIPQDKDQLFRLAQQKIAAGEHDEGRRLLRHFRSNYPTDPRADDAQLMLGDSYFAEQQFPKAIVEYRKIIDAKKKTNVYPDALYKVGMALYQLKFCSDAQLFLNQLVKRYRRHKEVARARKVLRLIRQYKRNPKFCR